MSVSQMSEKKGSESQIQHPALEKVETILRSTPPADWSKWGEKLGLQELYAAPYEYWEYLFALSLSTGLLLLRSSQKVKWMFVKGGYKISPVAPIQYSIELRPHGWNPKQLVDPHARKTASALRQFDLLADGPFAQKLFAHVESIVEAYQRERQKQLEEDAVALLDDFVSGRIQVFPEAWQRTASTEFLTTYASSVQGISIEISRSVSEETISFEAVFTRDKNRVHKHGLRQLQLLFGQVEGVNRIQQLEQLGRVLEQGYVARKPGSS